MIKTPTVLEFIGIENNKGYTKSKIEQALSEGTNEGDTHGNIIESIIP